MRFSREPAGYGNFAGAPFNVQEFLARPLVARLATAGPVLRPVWFLWEEEAFWVLTGAWSSLRRRLAEDPTFELVIDTCDVATGETLQVKGRGAGTVQDFDAERGRRKLVRYLGPNEESWDKRFGLRDEVRNRDLSWARLIPGSLVVSDLSFRPSVAKP